MFIKAVVVLLFAVFSVTAQAQIRPLAERAVPPAEVSIEVGGLSAVILIPGKINSPGKAQRLRDIGAEAAGKHCKKERCTVADKKKLVDYINMEALESLNLQVAVKFLN
jgi:hypothetical protein